MSIHFQIKLETGQVLTFDVQDRRDADLSEMSAFSGVPSWARLEHHQCSICPFDTKDTKYCPAAFEMQDVIAQCSNHLSYEKIDLSRISENGTVTTQTDMQTALFAVIGEKAISSACKVLNTRRWTLNYYSILPTPENLFYRFLSSYLVWQFLKADCGQEPDFELKNHLEYIDKGINVFGHLLERFRQVSVEDASNNAIFKLVIMAKLLQKRHDKWIEDLKNKIGI